MEINTKIKKERKEKERKKYNLAQTTTNSINI